jgi:hypothetical protein
MKYFLKTADEASLWAFLESVSLAVKDFNPEDEANQPPEDADEAWEPSGEFVMAVYRRSIGHHWFYLEANG